MAITVRFYVCIIYVTCLCHLSLIIVYSYFESVVNSVDVESFCIYGSCSSADLVYRKNSWFDAGNE